MRGFVLWAVVGLGLVVSACSSVDPVVNSNSASGPGVEILRVHSSDRGGEMDAIVSGVVEADLETGCVWLSDAAGSRYPVVWPIGTTAQRDPFEIRLADGETIRPGDLVQGGGGYIDAAAATQQLSPFPAACLQVGQAAVFNARSPIRVTPGVGLEVAETLLDRFSSPAVIPVELIAVNANARSVAVVDFVTGTVHLYQPGQYVAPKDPINGASGGGGFIHLWADGTIYTYPGRLDGTPLVFEPDPLRRTPGVASTLEVLPAPDGDLTWLVQPGPDSTLVELVNVVGGHVTRLGSYEIDGSWQPAGTTPRGLVVVTDDPEPRTALIGTTGAVLAEVSGTALSVGSSGAAILQPDDSLTVTDALLGNATAVEKPGEGNWVSVGGPLVPATAPPVVTGDSSFLVELAEHPGQGLTSGGDLIVVNSTGGAIPIYELSTGDHVASWSRDKNWVVVVEGSNTTLVPINGGAPSPLGELTPKMHWVLTVG